MTLQHGSDRDSSPRRDCYGNDADLPLQQERQRDQRAHALDLLQQRHLRVTLLDQRFDPFVILADPLTQFFDATATVPVLIAVPELARAFSLTLQPRSLAPLRVKLTESL